MFSNFPESVWDGDSESWTGVISFVGRTTLLNFPVFISMQCVYQYLYISIYVHIYLYTSLYILRSVSVPVQLLSFQPYLKVQLSNQVLKVFCNTLWGKSSWIRLQQDLALKSNHKIKQWRGEMHSMEWNSFQCSAFPGQVIREEFHLGAERVYQCVLVMDSPMPSTSYMEMELF